jgi:hypothetical protein
LHDLSQRFCFAVAAIAMPAGTFFFRLRDETVIGDQV